MEELLEKLDTILQHIHNPRPDILTIKDVEREYKLSPHTQREARRDIENPLEYISTKKEILYRREALERYMDSLTIQ